MVMDTSMIQRLMRQHSFYFSEFATVQLYEFTVC